LFFVLTCTFLQAFTIQAQDQNVWGKPYIGSDVNLLYYPDQNANYFRYAWESKPGLEIIVKGKMPESRYFSFNLYDDYHKSSIEADTRVYDRAGRACFLGVPRFIGAHGLGQGSASEPAQLEAYD
jgi:hypothetical protein